MGSLTAVALVTHAELLDPTQPRPLAMPAPRPGAATHRRFAVLVDRVGAAASLVCAVHCVLLPFVLALLPLVGLAFLGGAAFERIFVSCAAALSSASILAGFRRHRRPQPLYLMVPGIVLLLFGVAINLEAHLVIHTACEVAGGVLLASAHITNLVLSHRYHRSACGHAHVRPGANHGSLTVGGYGPMNL